MSLGLKQYYEPLRLPLRANALSFPYTHQPVVSPPPKRASSTGQCIFLNMPSLLPRETPRATSVIPARVQRPSPFDHRVGISISFTRLLIGSLALRPALLRFGNSRPRVTTAPLPLATKAHGQLLGRDFNPLDALLLLRTVASCIIIFYELIIFCRIIRRDPADCSCGRDPLIIDPSRNQSLSRQAQDFQLRKRLPHNNFRYLFPRRQRP